MNRNQIENLYKANGLKDFKLGTTEDLLKVHGIDFKAVDGYSRLDDLNRAIYEKAIINIFNAWGLESRSTLIPKGIYYVEDMSYLVKENPEDDFFTVAGGVVMVIDRNGMKSLLHNWIHEDYKHLEISDGSKMYYLRFEYEHQGRNEWLHITKEGKEWY